MGGHRCTHITKSQGNPLIPLDMNIERTLRVRRRMVNEGIHNQQAQYNGLVDRCVVN